MKTNILLYKNSVELKFETGLQAIIWITNLDLPPGLEKRLVFRVLLHKQHHGTYMYKPWFCLGDKYYEKYKDT